MDTTGHNNTFADQGKDLVNKTADKVQGGVQAAKNLVDDTGNMISSKADNLRNSAGPAIDKVTSKVKDLANQGRDAVGNAAQQARDSAAYASDSLMTFTRDNPVKALLWAGLAGALLMTFVRALTPSRD